MFVGGKVFTVRGFIFSYIPSNKTFAISLLPASNGSSVKTRELSGDKIVAFCRKYKGRRSFVPTHRIHLKPSNRRSKNDIRDN